jgi:hypothetical protein
VTSLMVSAVSRRTDLKADKMITKALSEYSYYPVLKPGLLGKLLPALNHVVLTQGPISLVDSSFELLHPMRLAIF